VYCTWFCVLLLQQVLFLMHTLSGLCLNGVLLLWCGCLCLLPLQHEREQSLKDFSSGAVRVLIATDVASRGLDVKGIGHVINMDLPRAFEDYVHRIGEWRVQRCLFCRCGGAVVVAHM